MFDALRTRRRRILGAATAVAVVTGLVASVGATGTAAAADNDAVLEQYAADTWRSMAAMAHPRTGLPSDNIGGSLKEKTRSEFTSPTNIGGYLWSTVAARDIGLISGTEARERIAKTLASVAKLERHEPSGMFYNWYNPNNGKKLYTFPESGDPIKPFLSSVDNGWLANGLLLTERAVPALADEAREIREGMDFSCYYNPAENAPGGQIRGGFWDEDPQDAAAVKGAYCGGPEVWYTGHHYGAFNTEPRIASYLGIAAGQIPDVHYFGTYRTFPNDNCDWSWTETKPVGTWREYLGQRVFEGALPYRGLHVVPTWGGSMFEALMVPLFVPEEEWGPRSWGVNHPLFVEGQIEHGMDEAGYGYWGFSPSNNPAGGYREYGVDQLGMDGAGYTSDQERTSVDQAYGDCRAGSPAPTEYGDGVVTPHASFLALRYAEDAALKNLRNIKEDFDAYGAGGFYDAVAVRSGQVSQRYLALDQGMVMAALGNRLADDSLRGYVSKGAMKTHLEPMMRMEEFAAGRAE
ncbi:MAG TPA: glucoamylase family protein [Nocardioides sp.]|uniref:glucoamylase family protein n=1 Tax=Nocardioides sp. TaxID=35761 RepID=UPI002D800314|nr:glucoamylase family protein [Nocardioides sp.]HET6652183.1 glucoamylase family protein [Nocardioides sp.]